MESNWKITVSNWITEKPRLDRFISTKKGYRASHIKCVPVAFFYVQRFFEYDLCINCGERVPNHIQFQVDLLNGK